MGRGVALDVLAITGALAGQANAETYVNARFGYLIDYPAQLLVPGRESDNGDGREFRAQIGTAKMMAWGGYNVLDLSPTQIARNYEKDCLGGQVGYRVARRGLVAFSCVTPAGRVLYQKTLVGGDVLATVRFDYPLAERATWDPVVTKVVRSLSLRSHAP